LWKELSEYVEGLHRRKRGIEKTGAKAKEEPGRNSWGETEKFRTKTLSFGMGKGNLLKRPKSGMSNHKSEVHFGATEKEFPIS